MNSGAGQPDPQRSPGPEPAPRAEIDRRVPAARDLEDPQLRVAVLVGDVDDAARVGRPAGRGRIVVPEGEREWIASVGGHQPEAVPLPAEIPDPSADETVTLNIPDGFQIDGSATQKVPERSTDGGSRNRPVTWKEKAGPIGKHTLTVKSSAGDAQSQMVTIKASSIFD